MIAALDVGYTQTTEGEIARCAVVGFHEWTDELPVVELVVDVDEVRPYIPGRLFERELPALIAGLDALGRELDQNNSLRCIVVDGNVRLDPGGAPGLGMRLYEQLGGKTPVIGVAKSRFRGLQAVEVLRGSSSRPLYVTAAGCDEGLSGELVRSMAGAGRIPRLLRRVDALSRSAFGEGSV